MGPDSQSALCIPHHLQLLRAYARRYGQRDTGCAQRSHQRDSARAGEAREPDETGGAVATRIARSNEVADQELVKTSAGHDLGKAVRPLAARRAQTPSSRLTISRASR